MKKKIFSIFGVALTLVLLVSLFGFAVPASAQFPPKDLEWSSQSIPSSATYQLAPGKDAEFLTVLADGTTVFVVDTVGTAGVDVVYKSTNGGRTWAKSTLNPWGTTAITALAVSPAFATDKTVIVAAGLQVYISIDGGTSFAQLGGLVSAVATEVITSLAISPTYSGGLGEIMVGTKDTAAGATGNVYIWGRLGVLNWVPVGGGLNEDITSLVFSPNYPIDATILAVGTNPGVTLETFPPAAGAAEWTTTGPTGYSGDYCVKLTALSAAKVWYGDTLETLADIGQENMTFRFYFQGGPMTPYGMLYLDTTHDGVVDALLVAETDPSTYTIPDDMNKWSDAKMYKWSPLGYDEGATTSGATICATSYAFGMGPGNKSLTAWAAENDCWKNATVMYVAHGHSSYVTTSDYVDDIIIGSVTYNVEPIGTRLHTQVGAAAWDATVGIPVAGPTTIDNMTTEVGYAPATDIVSSAIAMGSDFNSSVLTTHRVYVALVSELATDDIYQVYMLGPAATVRAMLAGPGDNEFTSLAYSGDFATGNLLAGNDACTAGIGTTATVMRCANPTLTMAWLWVPATTPPTGTSTAAGPLTYIALAPDFATSNKVFASTRGTESAVSVSDDGGVNFYQAGMIDTRINGVTDFQPSPSYATDSTMFMATRAGFSPRFMSLALPADDTLDLNVTTAFVDSGATTVTITGVDTAGAVQTATVVITTGQVVATPLAEAVFGASPVVAVTDITMSGTATAGGLSLVTNTVDVPPVHPVDTVMGTYNVSAPESVWKTTDGGTAWYRVLAKATVNDSAIVRVSPNYATDQAVYFAETGATDIRMSSNAGSTWSPRISPVAIADLVVEDANTIYVGSAATAEVVKSVTGGWTWIIPSAALTVLPATRVICMARDATTGYILVGTDLGVVWLSMNSGVSFIPAGGIIGYPDVTAVAFDANFATNKMLYAAGSGAGIYRLQFMAAQYLDRIDAVTALTAGDIVGLACAADGTLYAADSRAASYVAGPPVEEAGGVLRSLTPTAPLLPFDLVSGSFEPVSVADKLTAGYALDSVVVAEGSNKVFAILHYISTVRAMGMTMISGVSSVYVYTDTLTTVSPELVSPADGAISATPTQVILSWNAVTGATGYDYQVSTRSDFADLLGVAGGSVNAPTTSDWVNLTFPEGSTLYWRVRAGTPVFGPWSSGWSFSTQLTSPVNAPVPTSPAATTRTHVDVALAPVFNWEPLKWATGYEFQLANDAAFKSLILNLTGARALGNVTSYQLTEALAYSTTCYWRVRGISATGSSDWSAGVGFTTMAEPVEEAPPVVVEEYQPPDIIVEIPAAEAPVSPSWIWAIVIIGAVLVIAVVVLIVRTRRPV